MTTPASGLSLVLAAMRPSFQPCGSSKEYQPVAEPARYFPVGGGRGRHARLKKISSLGLYLLLALLTGNLDDCLRRPLESETLRAG